MHRGPGARGMGRFGRFGARERPSLEQMQQRNAEMFAQLDANADGRVTLEEFQAYSERQRQERQRRMFERFSGGQDSVTLEQLNARTAERYNQRQSRGPGGGARGQ